ncbi:MAG: hypothetical protein AAFR31_21690 [Cyanobacteria bacterium J06627_8]
MNFIHRPTEFWGGDRHSHNLLPSSIVGNREHVQADPSGISTEKADLWISDYLATGEFAIASTHHYPILVLP